MTNQRLIRYLKQGGVIAYPTESCYGLGCDPKNKYAVEKILWLKKTSRSTGFILISSKINHLRAYMKDLSETQK